MAEKDKIKYGEFGNVLLGEDEYEKLVIRIGEPNTKILIEELSTYMAMKRTKYLSHYAVLLAWARRKVQEHQQKKLPTKIRTII